MKKILAILFLGCSFNLNAQDLILPPVSTLKTEADLNRTKPDLIKAANWLEKNPLDTTSEKRREVERFVFMWISASKKVHVNMNQKVLSFDEKNPGLVMIYTASVARYILQKNKPLKDLEAETAALSSIASMYSQKKSLQKDKVLESLVKAQRKNRIKEWYNE